MAELDLTELREFGAEAHRMEFPSMATGGYVVSGRRAAATLSPGKEQSINGTRPQARPTAGPWQRPSAEAAAPGSASHAVKRSREVARTLDELSDYGAPVAVVRSSDRFVHLKAAAGLFASLPFRAELLFEVPLKKARTTNAFMVPDVRVWSRWTAGIRESGFINSHHIYPDRSMCVCMREQWQIGRDALITYVDFSILWVARVLHERLLGYYPGLQHYGEMVRLERDRVNEYCGCGRPKTYASCHRSTDQAMPQLERLRRHYAARRQYLNELREQGRELLPPAFAPLA